MRKTAITVLFPEEGESSSSFVRRLRKTEGQVLVVLSGLEEQFFPDTQARATFLTSLSKMSGRLRLATRQRALIAEARARGLRVIDQAKDLQSLLQGHAQLDEAMRVFSPHLWRQQLRSRLQSMGLLALPKLRIWLLIMASGVLFFFVLFRLLPSATITVKPYEETITQTSNIFLVQNGAEAGIPQRVRTMRLHPIDVEVSRSITFDQISKEYVGSSAEVTVTVINESEERYGLREGTRIRNQAGMVFRLQKPVIVDSGDEVTVRAVADDRDMYNEIIGERGNVPAGVKWEFPGLSPEERRLVYAENREPATGGSTMHRTVLMEDDLKFARDELERELLATANQLVDEQIALLNAQDEVVQLKRLFYEELTKHSFSGFVLPTQFLGEQMNSVPVEGSISYTAYAYDSNEMLQMLQDEMRTHVEADKRLIEDSMSLERLVVHVIDYESDLSWIKLTVDLSGTQQAILDPMTPTGARFGKKVRELVLGATREEAERILKNLPEVQNVEVFLWPPWHTALPRIPYHISIEVSK